MDGGSCLLTVTDGLGHTSYSDPLGLLYLDIGATLVLFSRILGGTAGFVIDLNTGDIYGYAGWAGGMPGAPLSGTIGLSDPQEGPYGALSGSASLAYAQGGMDKNGKYYLQGGIGVGVGMPGLHLESYNLVLLYDCPGDGGLDIGLIVYRAD